MARKVCISDIEVAQARLLREQAKSASELRKALSVLLIAELGLDSDKAADILGTSKRTVFRNRRNISSQDGISRKTWGGRRNCIMTIEEEREFLSQWVDSATAGQVLSVPPIHVALVERLGHATPTSTTYRLLARHGWRKVQPDTKHPKSDPVAQEEFKKNSPKLWMPPV
jgi:transposase